MGNTSVRLALPVFDTLLSGHVQNFDLLAFLLSLLTENRELS